MDAAPQKSVEQLEAELKQLQDKYVNAMSTIALSEMQSKQTVLVSFENRDKLIGEYLTFGLLTLGAAATLLSAKADIIKTKPLFVASLALLACLIIFTATARVLYRNKISRETLSVSKEYQDRQSSIIAFYMDPSNNDLKVIMEQKMSDTKVAPTETTFIRISLILSTLLFIGAFLLLTISLLLRIQF